MRPEEQKCTFTMDLKEVLKKSKVAKNKSLGGFLSLNHLSPSRNMRRAKDQEEYNAERAARLFEQLVEVLETKKLAARFEEVHAGDI